LSSIALVDALRVGLRAANLPEASIQLVPVRDRDAVGHMLGLSEFIDVIVPRGGKSLIERVMREARMPVIAHLDGMCHTYIHEAADAEMARTVTFNAKMRRPSVCGATETLLVDRAAAVTHLPPILHDLMKAGCEIRGDAGVQKMDPRVKPATEADWSTEYLDAILAVKLVDGLDQAIDHINRYGSHHTDAIVTADRASADAFLARVDSAIVLHNASTQFADGGEFGFGAEIGISTGRMPPRGPVGAEQLTSYNYRVRGTGQVRP
jgi:glutamate-5-semialdehyde dehydrogenase